MDLREVDSNMASWLVVHKAWFQTQIATFMRLPLRKRLFLRVRRRLLLLNQMTSRKKLRRRPQSQWLRHQRKMHERPSPKIPLICCHRARWCLMTGRGYTGCNVLISVRTRGTQRATSTRLPLKVFWDMYTQRVALWFCYYKYQEDNITVVCDPEQGWRVPPADGSLRQVCCRQDACDWSPFKAKGLRLFCGADIPKFVMEEVYEWTKVDISGMDQKERVDVLEPFDGQALLDAKCFKGSGSSWQWQRTM